MFTILQRLPFLTELFYNGSFILIFGLREANKIPKSWNLTYIDQYLTWASWFVPLVLFFIVVVNFSNSSSLEEFLRRHVFGLVIFVPLVMTIGDLEFTFWLASSHLLASLLSVYDGERPEKSQPLKEVPLRINKERSKESESFSLSPPQLVLISFLGLITVGTLLLLLPFSTVGDKTINLVDALFMATSATCVTGLSTLSLSSDLSLFGQGVILTLIQIGGLGYMTLSSMMAMILGRSMAMKDRIILQDLLSVSSQEELLTLIVDIIRYTFIIELWGAILLTSGFLIEGLELGPAIYHGVFHSISAFCNAGFALFDNSLESFATRPLIHGTISVLVILGGLGFVVLRELKLAISEKRSFVRFSIHSKIVLVGSGVLIFSGFLFFFFGEFLYALDGHSLWEKVQISFFQSVTLRTAGFNTIALTELNKNTVYMMAIFMFIGAAPGSTSGGIKVTTFAILVQSIQSTLKGRESVEIFERKIPSSVVVRATALTIISLMISSLFIFILMSFEPEKGFLPLFFEVVSASGTVGLSLGVTPYLAPKAKLLVALLMFIGRTGPLTLVLAIGAKRRAKDQFDYPEGRVLIG